MYLVLGYLGGILVNVFFYYCGLLVMRYFSGLLMRKVFVILFGDFEELDEDVDEEVLGGVLIIWLGLVFIFRFGIVYCLDKGMSGFFVVVKVFFGC